MKPHIQAYVDAAEPFKVATTKMLYSAPPVEYLVAGILPTHAICGLTGAPGTGKTWLAMEMMRAVVTGTKFLGQFETQQGPALYVGADASFLDYAQQWWRLTHEVYESYTQEQDGELVRNDNPFDTYADFLLQSDFNLDEAEMVGRLIKTSENVSRPSYYEEVMGDNGWEQVEREGKHYRLIVYDTLTKLTRSPENDSVARDLVFEHLRDIAEATGATLLVLHHPPLVSEFRSGEEWRGAGSQFGALDAHFHILRDNGRQDVIQFKVKKFRGITPKPFLFNLNVFDNENEATLAFMEPTKDVSDWDNDMLDALVAAFDKRGGHPATIADLAIALMQDPTTHDIYEGDVTKLKNRIRNLLKREVAKPESRIVRVAAGAGRAGGLYAKGVQPAAVQQAEEDNA